MGLAWLCPLACDLSLAIQSKAACYSNPAAYQKGSAAPRSPPHLPASCAAASILHARHQTHCSKNTAGRHGMAWHGYLGQPVLCHPVLARAERLPLHFPKGLEPGRAGAVHPVGLHCTKKEPWPSISASGSHVAYVNTSQQPISHRVPACAKCLPMPSIKHLH